jgi:hypothetical protein
MREKDVERKCGMKEIRNYFKNFGKDLKGGANLKEKGVDEGIILNGT